MSEDHTVTYPEGHRNSCDEDILEPKAKPKIIRVLTVVAYTLSVSMVAILLSVYYVFMWDGHPRLARRGPVANYLRGNNITMDLPVINYHEGRKLEVNESGNHKLVAEAEKEYFNVSSICGGSNGSFVEGCAGQGNHSENVLVDIAFEPTAIPVMEATVTTRTEDLTEELVEEDTYVEQNSTKIEALKIRKRSPIMLEKLFNKHMLN